ncbi:MAG: hypothetical protein D8H99_61290 [Streptococcus sp.]|nr:MAG: hypothetical protein D8H99_61290 [Streptococcus sp.]
MIGLTFSVKMNKAATNIPHNNRTLTEEEYKQPAHEHIIREKSSDNIVIRQSTIQEAYKEVFGEAVEEYNAKQKRKDRQIKDYYKHVYHSKTLDLQREMIIGLGNKEDWEKLGYEKKKEAGQLIKEVIEDFIRDKKDHIHVYNAVVHLDEAGAPHAHINFIPLAHNYKNGLKTQPSWTKSLAQMGYPGKGRKPFMAFRETEVERIGRIAKKYGIERKLGETNPLPDVQTYKRVKDLEKQAKAKEAEIEGLEQEYSQKDRVLKEQYTEQARALKSYEEKLKSELEAKEIDLELLDGELAEKQELAHGAEESARQARQQAQEAQGEAERLQKEADRLKSQVIDSNRVLSEKDQLINRQEAQLERNDQLFNEQTRQYDEQTDFINRRTRALKDIERASRVIYNDENVRPNKLNPDEVILKKEHYKNLKQRAGFSDIIGNFASTIVSQIQQTSIYKALEAEMNKWKNAYNNLKAKYNKLEKENENLRQELGKLRHQNDVGRDLGMLCERYLPQDERDSLYRRLSRLKKEEDKRLERDDFSYDYEL